MEGQLKNGTILTSESGNKYTVVNLLGAGGQGEVYDVECDGKHYALKWYFKGSATARQKKLLEEIIAKGAPDSSFLWPMELIVPSQGNLFGYIMPLRPKNYKSIVDLMKNRVNPSFYVISRTAFNLTKGYRNLHIAGAKYQDISFGNLFFNPDNGDVLICDNDNVSYGNSKPGGVLGTPGFMAPEIVRGEARPSRDTDRYSLAVLLFYLFMVNHPLEGKQEASIKCMDMAARVKLYGTDPIFIFDPDNKTNRPVPGIHDNANIYWPLYPEQLRQLFIKSALLRILAVLSANNLFEVTEKNHDRRIETIKTTLTYIQENYKEKIYIRDLAGLIGMNEQYFCRFFKKVIGRSPMEYVNEYRIKKAMHYLKESDLTVTEICLECGYNNLGNFLREFLYSLKKAFQRQA